MSLETPKISVVVCTYNRSSKICRCLDALLSQTMKRADYEIIVVNDGSRDKTAEVLSKYEGSVKVITNNPNQGVSKARNVGVSKTKSEIIAFTDDDCKPDEYWLESLLLAYSSPKIAGVGGKIIPYRTDKWLLEYYEANNPLAHLPISLARSSGIFYRLLQYLKRSFLLSHLPDHGADLFMIVSANMSVRRSVFNAVGGFDTSIHWGGEDEDFWKRVRNLKSIARLRYNPSALIRHNYDSSFRDALHRNRSYGSGSARLLLKYDDRIPAIYPFPIIILFSILLIAINPYFVIFTFLLVIATYPGWINIAIRKKHLHYIFYSAVQISLEMATTYGFIQGYLRLRRQGSGLKSEASNSA
jgi:O-antigen biosynthesis protein